MASYVDSLKIAAASVAALLIGCSAADTSPSDAPPASGAPTMHGAPEATATAPNGSAPGAPQGGTLVVDDSTRDECATASFERNLVPSSLLFVVDRSGSMSCNLPPITDSTTCEAEATRIDPSAPSKWEVLSQALDGAIDEIASVPGASVGLTFFSNNDACGVQSAPNVGLEPLEAPQVDALKAALGAVTPRGGTPIVGSTILAYKHLHQEKQAPGNRFVVVVTDGADSCFDQYADQGVEGDPLSLLLATEMPKALGVNIRTFVIGAPGSEGARRLLSQMAWAGGTARSESCNHSDAAADVGDCHFDMTASTDFGADLAAALAQITGQAALSCELTLPQPDEGQLDPGKVNVDYYQGGTDKVELFRDDTAPCDGGADGWQYTEDNRKIQLCGSVCEQVRGDSDARVEVQLGCETRTIK